MESCSIGKLCTPACSGHKILITELTEDISANVGLGGKSIAGKFDTCPLMGRTEKWLLQQRFPSLNDTDDICETHRQYCGPIGQDQPDRCASYM